VQGLSNIHNVFKNSTGDFALGTQYGRLRAKTHVRYAITSVETEYRATDGNARKKCESAYKTCKATRENNKYVLISSKVSDQSSR
jgi:hypothetical protein